MLRISSRTSKHPPSISCGPFLLPAGLLAAKSDLAPRLSSQVPPYILRTSIPPPHGPVSHSSNPQASPPHSRTARRSATLRSTPQSDLLPLFIANAPSSSIASRPSQYAITRGITSTIASSDPRHIPLFSVEVPQARPLRIANPPINKTSPKITQRQGR